MSNYDIRTGHRTGPHHDVPPDAPKWKFGEQPTEDQTVFDDLFTKTTRQG